MYYGFIRPDGNYVNLDERNIGKPIVIVEEGEEEDTLLQCFLSASAADYYKNEMRNRYLEIAEEFDQLILTWFPDSLFMEKNFSPYLIRY